MKSLALLLGLFATAGLALADTWSGHVMDTHCQTKDPVTHTKQCVMSCAKDGLGLITTGGKYLKFDAAGNQKAMAALKATKKMSDLKATVTGTLQGDTIKVDTIAIQ